MHEIEHLENAFMNCIRIDIAFLLKIIKSKIFTTILKIIR